MDQAGNHFTEVIDFPLSEAARLNAKLKRSIIWHSEITEEEYYNYD